MKGIQTWRNPHNKFFVVRTHYTSDPAKDHNWRERAKEGVASNAQWEQEYEINFEQAPGMKVYGDFDRTIHVRDISYNPDLPMIRGWDFGFRHPACVFCQVDKDDRFLLYRSIVGENIVIHDFADHILNVSERFYPNAIRWEDYGDPAGGQITDKSEQTSIDMVSSLGIIIISKRSGIKEGLQTIRWHLKVKEGMEPGLLVKDCKETVDIVDGFGGGYHIKKDKDGVALEELPDKDGYYDHIFDAIRYVAINRLKQYSPKPIVEKRKKTYVDKMYDKLMSASGRKRRVY